MTRGKYKAFAAEGTAARQLEKSMNEMFSKMKRGGWVPSGSPIQVKDGVVVMCVKHARPAQNAPSLPGLLQQLIGSITTKSTEHAAPPVRQETISFLNGVMSRIPPSDLSSALQHAEEIVKRIAPKLGSEEIRCLAEDIKTLQEHHKSGCDDDECNHQTMMARIQKSLEELLVTSVC